MSTESYGEPERPRWLIPAVAAVVGVALIVVMLVVLSNRKGTATLNVSSIPGDLTLKLDDRQINANGVTEIPEGRHTLTASRRGFKTDSRTIDLDSGNSMTLGLVLLADGPEGRAYYRDHPDEEREAEAEAGRKFAEQGEERARRYPILNQLPYIGSGFKVDYGASKKEPNDPLKVALFIKTWSDDGRAHALVWLEENGVDPNTQEIIWSK